MTSEDERYRQSTQFRLWSFSPSGLKELRAKTNALATQHVSQLLASRHPTEPAPAFLTADDETVLLNFFTVELLRAGAFCELSTDVKATAAIFFRRFYTTNSLITYPPTELLKTCLFFGSKAEGIFYSQLAKFSDKFPNTSPEEIVAGEFLLCQGIRFSFDVRHPFRSLEGAILELRRLEPKKADLIHRAHVRARDILKHSALVTDAYVHFTPSQIMLAALGLANSDLFDLFLGSAYRGDDEALQTKLRDTVKACQEMLSMEMPERFSEYWGSTDCMQKVRPLLKRLKKCRDPDRVDLVALQRARREQANRKDPAQVRS